MIAVMILALFGSNAFGVQVAAILFFLIGSVLVLRYMNENEDRLVFNSLEIRQWAYPSNPKAEKAAAYFQAAPIVIFFVPLIAMRLFGVDMTGVPIGVHIPIFYIASLAFIGILQNVIRRRAGL